MGKKETDQWLERAFHAKDREALRAVYDDWAEHYDADLLEVGYLHVPIIAALVTRHVPSPAAAILDAGVGTGIVGQVLSILGYNNLSGLDMSEGMLRQARVRRCYADLRLGVLGAPLDFPDGSFDAIISTGTFTTGHAPAAAFEELTRILETDGALIFTVGTAVWEEQGFKTRLDGLVARKLLKSVETTPIYRPMPFSPLEGDLTTRAHVYRKL